MLNNLINFRKNNNLTQREMANILDITYSFYCKIERGVRKPSYNFLVKFKKSFSTASIDSIFFTS